jgi:hypothetical protein
LPSRFDTGYVAPVPSDEEHLDDWAGEPDPRVDDWADDSDPGDDKELKGLAADIGTIMAGRTVVPAAIMWWRTRRERRAEQEDEFSTRTERARRSRWFEIRVLRGPAVRLIGTW